MQSDVNNSSASHHLFLFTYANHLLITCAFRFNIHYLFVYLFKLTSEAGGGTDHLFLFTYGNWLLITCGFHFNIHYLFVYLFKAMSTKAGGSDHLFLFTYVNPFLITLLKCLYIKAMWTKAGGSDHLFLFTYGNNLLWDMVFVWIFIIYLFIYSKQCQQKQVELTTFIYLWKLLVLTHGFSF